MFADAQGPESVIDNTTATALSLKGEFELLFGVKNGVDMVFALLIRRSQDVFEIREVLGPEVTSIKIIVKIENEQGVANFDETLDACDVSWCMWQFGYRVSASEVFLAQKMMIAKCSKTGKPDSTQLRC